MNDDRLAIANGIDLPEHALTALSILEDAGHEAWVVGGFVRDALMGRPCNDVDIACSARWQHCQAAFEDAGCRTHETGTQHGTLTVIVGAHAIEVTTYRCDGAYSDGRHPDSVSFVSTIEEDLARRDFTMNAIAYHPDRGFADPFGGLCDIERRIIRTVGAPELRFSEDALRILRACRFKSQLGFSLDEDTLAAMKSCKSFIRGVSVERITYELDRFLLGDFVHDALMETVDVLSFVLPELCAMKDFDQRTPYHIYDVLEHSAWVVQNTPPDRLVRWAALIHDMGKPACAFEDGEVRHFYGHAHVSVELGRGIMTRFLMSPSFKDRVLLLVKRHDDVVKPNHRAVKRMLGKLGGDPDLFRSLCDLKRADALSQAPHCAARAETADELKGILESILAANEAFSLKQLAINGNDIMALGVKAGPVVGKVLEAALDAVVDEQVPNEREALLAFSENLLRQ